jgi:hypothetical protein
MDTPSTVARKGFSLILANLLRPLLPPPRVFFARSIKTFFNLTLDILVFLVKFNLELPIDRNPPTLFSIREVQQLP